MHPEERQRMDETATPQAPAAGWRRPRVRVGAVVALAIAAGVVVWLVAGRNDNSSSTSPTTSSAPPAPTTAVGVGPVAMSPAGLRALASKVKHPIYWAGAKRGFTYEVTETS